MTDVSAADGGGPAPTIAPDPDEEPTRRERLAALGERRLDPVMALLAVVWAGLVGYELVAPADQRAALALVANLVWAVFVVEFIVKLAVSGRPGRFLIRHWPAALFLVLPALRVLRTIRGVRALRLLPAARVLGSSYRAVGTARQLLQGRLLFLVATTVVAIMSGGQLLYVLEAGRTGGVAALGDAVWWAANLAMASTLVFEPVTLLGRLVALVLSAYAVVVFAALAAVLGTFLIESRRERAVAEEAEA